jgi:branched-chain amino acid transport system substrate-binding protein
MLEKRSLLATVSFALTVAAPAVADDTPGMTATEIKIGNTFAYSGPNSTQGVWPSSNQRVGLGHAR